MFSFDKLFHIPASRSVELECFSNSVTTKYTKVEKSSNVCDYFSVNKSTVPGVQA